MIASLRALGNLSGRSAEHIVTILEGKRDPGESQERFTERGWKAFTGPLALTSDLGKGKGHGAEC